MADISKGLVATLLVIAVLFSLIATWVSLTVGPLLIWGQPVSEEKANIKVTIQPEPVDSEASLGFIVKS